LPIDFDPPAVAQIQIELSRGDTKRVAFGLIPLGTIHGRVTRDANKNGKADPDEEPVDGAILILDGGARSEVARKGRYRFDAVRSGTHLLKLLADSLPAGAQIAGDAEVPALLARDALTAEITFLISMDKRPEIRRVFPSRVGARAPAKPTPSRTSGTRPIPRTTPTGPATGASAFAIQIAALNDPLRAREIVNQLKETGMAAYLVHPPSTDPDAPYRVRIGPYATRGAAETTAAALEKSRGEKLWVTREK
jgi:hypothetical protein